MAVRYYTNHDLSQLHSTLFDARSRWRPIGSMLGLTHGDLEAIDSNFRGNVENCLMESLSKWLNSCERDKRTNSHLAKVLLDPTVGRRDLAERVFPDAVMIPSNKQHYQRISLLHYSMIIGCLSILVGGMLYAYYSRTWNSDKDIKLPVIGRSMSLPHVKEDLFGREEEMQLIMDYLNNTEVDVITLFGSPGFGKSAIIKHVGHAMLIKGMDVHYIVVENFADISGLEQELMEISENFEGKRLMSWAKSLKTRTLLILDNVDGYHWVQDDSRSKFQKKFLDILQSYSTNLKILITSQQEIRASHRFRSYQLSSLNTDNCVLVLNNSVTGIQVTFSDAETVCDLVGGVPLAIKVLAATLSPPVNCSINYVIQRLNDTSKLDFIADKGNLTSEDRILTALVLAFEFVKKEHQICGLLMVRFTGSFSLDIIKSIVTPELMEQFTSNFNIEDCLFELNMKSFIEVASSLHFNGEIKYHFHLLIRDFLEISTNKHNISDALDIFWKNYLNWLSSENSFMTMLSEEDFIILVRMLQQETDRSHYLAVSLTSNILLMKGLYNKHVNFLFSNLKLHQLMLNQAISRLISDCQEPSFIYPITNVAKVIDAYVIAFEEILCHENSNIEYCMNMLQLCQPKIEQLHFLANGNHDAMKSSSYFHNNILDIKCMEFKNASGICRFMWKHHLLGLGEMLADIRDICIDHCREVSSEVVSVECRKSFNTSLVAGLEFYAIKDYDKALHHLKLALKDSHSSSSCHELYEVTIYMALFDIYSELYKMEEADACITSILNIDFQGTNISCYTAIYGDTVIPFLKEINETKLAKELRDLRFDSYMEAIGQCKGNALNCNNENRYKTPILNTLHNLAPLWVPDMVAADTSLFCSVTKEVMVGCRSPFPLFTVILKAQYSMSQEVHRKALGN